MAVPALSFLELNDDVLECIVAFLAPRDALNLSLASRVAHAIAEHQAVSSISLVLGQTRVLQFCDYMLSEAHDRTKYLRELEILPGAIIVPPNVTNTTPDVDDIPLHLRRLTDLLTRAKNLRSLKLQSCENMLSLHPPLAVPLSRLPNLIAVELRTVGPKALRLLSEMVCQPRRVSLHTLSEATGQLSLLESVTSFNAIQDFELYNTNLKSDFGSGGWIQTAPTSLARALHSVRKIVLTNVEPMRMDVLSRAFPEVRKVDVYDCKPVYKSEGPIWASLDYVRGDAYSLSCWPTICPTKHIELRVIIVLGNPSYGQHQREAVIQILKCLTH